MGEGSGLSIQGPAPNSCGLAATRGVGGNGPRTSMACVCVGRRGVQKQEGWGKARQGQYRELCRWEAISSHLSVTHQCGHPLSPSAGLSW